MLLSSLSGIIIAASYESESRSRGGNIMRAEAEMSAPANAYYHPLYKRKFSHVAEARKGEACNREAEVFPRIWLVFGEQNQRDEIRTAASRSASERV